MSAPIALDPKLKFQKNHEIDNEVFFSEKESDLYKRLLRLLCKINRLNSILNITHSRKLFPIGSPKTEFLLLPIVKTLLSFQI